MTSMSVPSPHIRRRLEHSTEDRADTEEVAPPIERVAHRLLGRHVRRLAFDLAGLGQILGFDLGDTEVEEPYTAVVADHHVLRGHVPVNEVERCTRRRIGELVSRMQPATYFGEHVRHAARGQAFLRLGSFEGTKNARERLAFDVLHREVQLAIELPVVVRAHDVRVIEHRGETRLAEKHLRASSIAACVWQEALQGDDPAVSARSVRRCPIDFERRLDRAHSPAPEHEEER